MKTCFGIKELTTGKYLESQHLTKIRTSLDVKTVDDPKNKDEEDGGEAPSLGAMLFLRCKMPIIFF